MEWFPCNVSAIWLGRPALGFLLSFTTSSCTVKWKSVFFMVQFPPHFFAFHCYPYLQNNSVMRLYAKEQSMHLLTEQVEREQLWTQTAAWELQCSCVCQHERLETKKKPPTCFTVLHQQRNILLFVLWLWAFLVHSGSLEHWDGDVSSDAGEPD